MKTRTVAGLLVAALALSAPLGAQVVKYKDFDKTAEFQLLTTEQEKGEWKNLKTDAEAEKFIMRFWARRDPDLKTPENEFQTKWNQRVAEANKAYLMGRIPGMQTERGKLMLLMGLPTRSTKRSLGDAGVQAPGSIPGIPGGTTSPETGTRAQRILQTLTYEKKDLPPWADVDSLEVSFEIDEALNRERIMKGGDVAKRLETKAAEAYLVNPQIQEVQTKEEAAAKAAAAAKAGDEAAEAKRGPTLTPAVREALEKAFGGEAKGPLTLISLIGRDGLTHLALQLTVPASKVTAPETTRLAVLVRSKDGKDAARREEPAALQKSKGDLFADRSLTLDAGDYDVSAALLDGSGAVLASAMKSVTVAPIPKEFAVSTLLLASNDYAAEGAKADDPFVFAQRKFIAPRDAQFDMADGLSYIVRVYNPSLDPASKKIVLSKTGKIKPKTGTAIDVPASRDEFTPGEMKEGATTFIDVGANIVENLGEYFQPGEYTLRITVTDVTTGKSFETSAPYKIVGTAKTAAPAPAPKKK